MSLHYSLVYTPQILRGAVFAYFRKIVGLWFPILLVMLACFVAYQFNNGDRSWLVGALAAFVLLVTAIVGALFTSHLRHANARARELASEGVSLLLSEQSLQFQSALGSVELPWSRIASIIRAQDFLLIEFKGGGYSSIPLASVDARGVEYLHNMVLNNGGKVV